MTDSIDARAWDRVAASIRGVLPRWARDEGYGTYALAGYVYAVVLAVAAVVVYALDVGTLGPAVIAVAALIAAMYGSYYRGAAKRRVTCSHCGARAHGASFCPECGQRTYTGGEQ